MMYRIGTIITSGANSSHARMPNSESSPATPINVAAAVPKKYVAESHVTEWRYRWAPIRHDTAVANMATTYSQPTS